MWISSASGPTTTPETFSLPSYVAASANRPRPMECTPSVARAASEAALASCSCSVKALLDPLLLLRLLLPALLLLLGLLLREEDVGYRNVDLGHPQPHEVLDPVDHVAAHRLGELGDGLAVLRRERKIQGCLFLTDLDRDTLGLAASSTSYGAEDAAHGLRGATAHPDAFYLLGRYTRDLRDHAVRDGGAATLRL